MGAVEPDEEARGAWPSETGARRRGSGGVRAGHDGGGVRAEETRRDGPAARLGLGSVGRGAARFFFKHSAEKFIEK